VEEDGLPGPLRARIGTWGARRGPRSTRKRCAGSGAEGAMAEMEMRSTECVAASASRYARSGRQW